MTQLEHLASAEHHVHAAGQARVEAPHGAHDVDTLERLGSVLLEQRAALDGVLVRTGAAEAVARARFPARRRIREIIGDPAVADHYLMREQPAHRLVAATTHRFTASLELIP